MKNTWKLCIRCGIMPSSLLYQWGGELFIGSQNRVDSKVNIPEFKIQKFYMCWNGSVTNLPWTSLMIFLPFCDLPVSRRERELFDRVVAWETSLTIGFISLPDDRSHMRGNEISLKVIVSVKGFNSHTPLGVVSTGREPTEERIAGCPLSY